MADPHALQHIKVILAKAGAYDDAAIRTVGELLDRLDLSLTRGDRVLVKPNLLRADALTCTNAMLVAGVCRYLRDLGCRVTLGDSPGFGTTRGIAKAIGLDVALERAGCADIPLVTLDSPVSKPLSLGGSIGLSRHALDADHICNLPKLKAHAQMRVTGAVKNLFGCISGVRKAFAHSQYGDKEKDGVQVFPALVADIPLLLPPVLTLMDGIVAMHVRGPSGGQAFPAHFLAASLSPVAVDTVVYSMLGLSPDAVPLWRELQRRKTAGAFLEDVAVSGAAPTDIDLSGFILPECLTPQTFNPVRLMVSTAKRLWARVRA
jgi:Uncharacterized conserved protein